MPQTCVKVAKVPLFVLVIYHHLKKKTMATNTKGKYGVKIFKSL
jgi:hypothetical protein